MTDNLPDEPVMNLTLQNESQCWGYNLVSSVPIQSGYYLTNEFNNATYYPDGNNLSDGESAGFDFVTSTSIPQVPVFAYGLYKVTNNINNKYFYIDYRDYRAGYLEKYEPPFDGNPMDVRIFYDGNFSFWDFSPPVNYESVSVGDVLRIWDIKGKGIPQTYFFPNFWSNALAVVNNGSGNPKLVWSAYPSANLVVKKYRIYRAVTQNTYPPPTPSFSLLNEVSPTTFEYTDLDCLIGGFLNLHYKITALVEDPELGTTTETSATNIEEVDGVFYKKGIKSNNKVNISLLSNYPNPFNPKTNISFHLNNSSYVTLSVYDVLGNLVSKLIDENKNEGIHQVTFDGSSLSSGVYLLVLMSDGKMISKKMILSK